MNQPNNVNASTPDTKSTDGKKTGRGTIGQIAIIGSAAIIAGGLYWLFASQYDEVTEDAYVDGNVVQVTPQIAGTVTLIGADNTDFVKAGQPLIKFNEVDAQLALARTEAQLAKAVRQARVQFATATQMKANITLRSADLSKAEADVERRAQLARTGAISGEEIRHAEDAVKSARAALTVAEQQYVSSQALVDQTTIATNPDVLNAASQVRDAFIAKNRTTLPAPVSGIVSKRSVQLGQRVSAGTPLMSIVPLDQIWVNANFKESQLRNLHVGQTVKLKADVYGDSVVYTGHIIGQDAGTGSAFSLMPAQNATGNWIKVVQRVPVRIALDPKDLAKHPLKLGLSMRAEVDTQDYHGAVVTDKPAGPQSYQTSVFANEVRQADRLVQGIIQANTGGEKSATY